MESAETDISYFEIDAVFNGEPVHDDSSKLSTRYEKLEPDWLTELRFNVPLDTSHVIPETFFTASLLAQHWKLGVRQWTVKLGLWGYSINKSGFGYIVNPKLESVKNCIVLINLNPDSVNPAGIPFPLRHEIGDEC